MENLKANLQNFDNRLDFHWVSLVPTVFRRVFRSISVGFLPLEKSPGGFWFQATFRVRFPKPQWNLFYIQILPGIASLYLNDVTKKSDNIWLQSNSPPIMIQLNSEFPRLILTVSIPFREQVVFSNNLLLRLHQFAQSERTTIPVGSYFFNFKTRKTTLINSWVLRFLLMDKIYIEEFEEIGVIVNLLVTLVFTWRIVIRRFAMFGIFPCGFQIHRNKMRWDLLTVRQLLRGLRERFIHGDLYHNLGFNSLEVCLHNGHMRFLAQWLGIYEYKEIRETMVTNEQHCIQKFMVMLERITKSEYFKKTLVRKFWCHHVYISGLALDTSAFMLRFVKRSFSQKLLHTNRNKEKSNMKLDNNRFFDRLASKTTLRKASSNSLLLYFS